LETRTPLLVRSPGMEPHIRPFKLERGSYLPTSPEFAMKKLLVGGLEKIFQICPAFRDEPRSHTHLPEFTLLEWYRAHADELAIMRDVEELVAALARDRAGTASGPAPLRYQGRELDVTPPWPRLKVRDLFAAHGVDLAGQHADREALAVKCRHLGLEVADRDSWDDLYFRIWLNRIEPGLPADRAVFVHRYPKSQSALAVVDEDPDGSLWARRFEFYLGGIELGNAFCELVDPVEQRRRFETDMELRSLTYGADFPVSPIDEEFMDALAEGLPPSAGIAVGVERLAMLFADEVDIGFLHWLDPASDSPGQ
ncbi:MAG: amino acid--tRNA ligase-related protein, partial [Bdellovibrionota bacterium]